MADRARRPPNATILPTAESADTQGQTIVAPDVTDAPARRPVASTVDLPDTPRAPKPLAQGSKLGRWVLDHVLGDGATATVWSATHEQLGAPVAIKVFHRQDLPFQTVLGEARAAAGIPSRNAIWVYDVDTFDGHHAIVMELCATDNRIARSLKEELIDTPDLAARLIAEAARGVQAAHEGGIFHKDIKPANILRNPDDGRAQITDFGLANPALWSRRARSQPHESQGTVCMEITVDAPADALDTLAPIRGSLRIGTPEFMAPEQAQGLRRDLDPDNDLDRRFLTTIDVYGLGATLYHLLTGAPPFPHGVANPEAVDAHTIMKQVVTGPPPPLRSVAPQVPRRLARIVDKAMARAPVDRYRTAGALADDLDAYISQRPTSVDTSIFTRARVHLGRERAPVALLSALALVTLGSSYIVALNVQEIAAQSSSLSEQRDELAALEATNAAVRRELATRENELSSTRNALTTKSGLLDATGKQLADREAALQTTSQRLSSTRSALDETSTTLATTAAALDQTSTALSSTAADLDSTRNQLAAAQERVAKLQAERDTLTSTLGTTQESLQAVQIALDVAQNDLRATTQRSESLTAQVATLQADVRSKQTQLQALETAQEAILREVELLRSQLDAARVDARQLREQNQRLERQATPAPADAGEL